MFTIKRFAILSLLALVLSMFPLWGIAYTAALLMINSNSRKITDNRKTILSDILRIDQFLGYLSLGLCLTLLAVLPQLAYVGTGNSPDIEYSLWFLKALSLPIGRAFFSIGVWFILYKLLKPFIVQFLFLTERTDFKKAIDEFSFKRPIDLSDEEVYNSKKIIGSLLGVFMFTMFSIWLLFALLAPTGAGELMFWAGLSITPMVYFLIFMSLLCIWVIIMITIQSLSKLLALADGERSNKNPLQLFFTKLF